MTDRISILAQITFSALATLLRRLAPSENMHNVSHWKIKSGCIFHSKLKLQLLALSSFSPAHLVAARRDNFLLRGMQIRDIRRRMFSTSGLTEYSSPPLSLPFSLPHHRLISVPVVSRSIAAQSEGDPQEQR